jgi:hypothetical protein
MSIAAELPLWPGMNFVTVVARENDHVRSTKYVYLYRDAQEAHASKETAKDAR